MAPESPLIKVENLDVVYNPGKEYAYTALHEINMEIYPGEYIILFGPSGCGKSTMLYTILGLQAAFKGHMYLNGRDNTSFTEKERTHIASEFFGIIFQNFNLIYSLNILDNVILPQMFTGVAPKARAARAHQLLERFGIGAKAKLLPNMISGGQQQRVAIARALVNNPQVLLADEPVGNLDSESAEVVMESLAEINHTDKKTVILVTHDASYLHYADRVFFFKDGRIDRVVVNRKRPEEEAKEKLAAANKQKLEMTPQGNELSRVAQTYGFLNVDELKAWSLTNYLVEECSAEQAERLERSLEKLLHGKLNAQEFFTVLHRPFSTGGVGLYRQTAWRYTKKVIHLLSTLHALHLEEIGKLTDIERRQRLHLFVDFLLEEYHGHLTPEQSERIQSAVEQRLLEKCTADAFTVALNRPVSSGGAGLNSHTVQHLADRLEIILKQKA